MALAQSASITTAKFEVTEDGYQLNADIDLQLTAGMQEAVRKGVPLYFIAEFQLTRGRWYWLDQSVISATRDRRIGDSPIAGRGYDTLIQPVPASASKLKFGDEI